RAGEPKDDREQVRRAGGRSRRRDSAGCRAARDRPGRQRSSCRGKLAARLPQRGLGFGERTLRIVGASARRLSRPAGLLRRCLGPLSIALGLDDLARTRTSLALRLLNAAPRLGDTTTLGLRGSGALRRRLCRAHSGERLEAGRLELGGEPTGAEL